MTAPPRRGIGQSNAAAAARKQRGNPLRRHWLSAAFIFTCLGLTALVGKQFVSAGQRLQEVRSRRGQLEARLSDAESSRKALQENLARVSTDSSLELMAKSMGYAYPQEKVYQTPSK